MGEKPTKLTDEQVRDLRSRYADGARQIDLAAEFGVNQNTVSSIVTGRSRRKAGGPISLGSSAKLSHADVTAMREAAAAGERVSVLETRYGVSEAMVYNVLTGKAFKDVAGPLTGTTRGRSKPLTEEQVGDILAALESGEMRAVLAARFGVSVSAIHHVASGRTKGVNNGTGDKFSRDDVVRMRELYRDGVPQTDIAGIFDTTQAGVSYIVRGRQYADYPGPVAGPRKRTLPPRLVTAIRVAFDAGATVDWLAEKYSTEPALVRLMVTGTTYPEVAGPTHPLRKRQQTVEKG